jgi:hypothetical protein
MLSTNATPVLYCRCFSSSRSLGAETKGSRREFRQCVKRSSIKKVFLLSPMDTNDSIITSNVIHVKNIDTIWLDSGWNH